MRKEVIGDATLWLGDCREILQTLSADSVLTDPPYGLGIAANPVRQKFAKADWDDAVPGDETMRAVLLAAREHIIWGGNYFRLPPTQGFLIWDKKQPEDFSLAMCEMAWMSRKMPAKIWRQSALSYAREHPTQKPVPLMEWCLTFITGRSVLDPFMGSGSTGVACVRMGLPFVGVEISESYFDIACRRISEAERQADMFGLPVPIDPSDARAADLFAEPG